MRKVGRHNLLPCQGYVVLDYFFFLTKYFIVFQSRIPVVLNLSGNVLFGRRNYVNLKTSKLFNFLIHN